MREHEHGKRALADHRAARPECPDGHQVRTGDGLDELCVRWAWQDIDGDDGGWECDEVQVLESRYRADGCGGELEAVVEQHVWVHVGGAGAEPDEPGGLQPCYGMLVLLACYDLWFSRRIYAATLWGGAGLIAEHPFAPLVLVHSRLWFRVAEQMQALGRHLQ